MKTKALPLALWGAVLVWMLLIFTLSSQNGTQTTQVSAGLAQTTAQVLYDQPTEHQVVEVHMDIRTAAHIVLFFVLGVLLFFACSASFGHTSKRRRWLGAVTAVVLACAYGFFDEWHKQFIDGRHFDLGETALNFICGVSGVLLAAFLFWCIRKIALLRKNKSSI